MIYFAVAMRECRFPFFLTSPSLILKVSHICDVMLSATPINLFAEDVKAASGEAAATPTKEAVQPPNYCLPSARNAAPPISAFYPHGYHTKVEPY